MIQISWPWCRVYMHTGLGNRKNNFRCGWYQSSLSLRFRLTKDNDLNKTWANHMLWSKWVLLCMPLCYPFLVEYHGHFAIISQGFFHKIFGGGWDLFSGTIFGPSQGESQMGGGFTSGTESDEGGLWKIVRWGQKCPLHQIRANFGVLSIK